MRETALHDRRAILKAFGAVAALTPVTSLAQLMAPWGLGSPSLRDRSDSVVSGASTAVSAAPGGGAALAAAVAAPAVSVNGGSTGAAVPGSGSDVPGPAGEAVGQSLADGRVPELLLLQIITLLVECACAETCFARV